MKKPKFVQLNFVVLTGIVVDFGTYITRKDKLGYRARIKVVNGSINSYVDLFGFGKVANTMMMTCNVGNIIYIEGTVENAKVAYSTEETVYAPYIRVQYAECLYRRRKMEMPKPNLIRLMDKLDPNRLVSEVFPEKKMKKERKTK